MTLFLAVLRMLGLPLVIVIVLIGYYEGLPFLKDIPLIDRVPIVRELVTGRVQSERVKAANAAREGYVLLAEKTLAEAKARKLEADAAATAKILDYYRQELVKTYDLYAKEDFQNEKDRKDYIGKNGGKPLTQPDIDWLCRNGC